MSTKNISTDIRNGVSTSLLTFLSGLYKNIHDQALIANKEQAILRKELALLRSDLPHYMVPFSISDLEFRKPEVFSRHKELLDSGMCYVVVISTPNMTHYEILMDIINHPKTHHVLVEKPLCTTVDDCGQAMLAKANAKVQKLRDSVRTLTEERKNLEKLLLGAEAELKRSRTKLRQAGKQIQGVISSAYKIERQAGGLTDIQSELPKRDASGFRSEVSQLETQAKKERRVLNKEVKKISDYGISV